jgi:glutaredoxin
MRLLFVVLAVLLLPALTYGGTMYKSVGADGKILYSDQPPTVGKVQKTISYVNLPATPLPESVRRYRDALEKSTKTRLSESQKSPEGTQATILTAQWCAYCQQAKAYLAEKKIAYKEYDIDTQEGMQALVEFGGGSGIPVLLWHGQKIKGFSAAAYDAVFSKSP